MTKPPVSAIITTKDEERYIGACLRSIQCQTYRNKEIIVVDSCSSDKTVDIARKYTKKIKVKETNVSEGRNLGAEYADGEILFFVDADTVLSEDWLDLVIPHFNSPRVVAVYGNRLPLEKSLKADATYCLLHLLDTLLLRRINIPGIGGGGMAVTAKKKAFTKIGGYNEALSHCEDTDLSIRLSKTGRIEFEKKAKGYFSTRWLKKYGYFNRILFWSIESFNYVFLTRPPSEVYPR